MPEGPPTTPEEIFEKHLQGEQVDVVFVGSELYSSESAQNIQRFLNALKEVVPRWVIDECERQGVGWLPDGNPDTRAIGHIERYMYIAAKVKILIICLNEMKVDVQHFLSKEEKLDILEEASHFNFVPQLVAKAVLDKKKTQADKAEQHPNFG